MISSPSAQKIVAGASVGQAIYGFTVDDISMAFSLTAGLLGIILTSLMIVKTYIQIKIDLKKGNE